MAIPTIHPYPMPTEAELPANVAAWYPVPDRAVVLVHDMQRYFVEAFPTGRPPVTDLVANVARIVAAARRRGIPIVYTAQAGAASRERRGLLFDFWGPGMSAEPGPRAIVGDLAPAAGDVVLPKVRYSAFHATGLAGTIRATGRDQLVVCGVYAHVGCLATAGDAFARDIRTFLVADAVADMTAEHHRRALEHAAATCAVVVTTDGLLAHFGEGVAR